MSSTKQIRKTGVHQEDLVEMVYYLWAGHASILTYLSTLSSIVSCIIGSLSAEVGSGSTTKLSISGLVSFPTSMTTATAVSITLI